MPKVYPTITTTDGKHLDKLNEANSLGLKEVCFFPTGLNYQERQKFYRLLEKSTLKKIPLVHIRDDFEVEELEFFIKRFKTQIFNCHSARVHGLKNDLHKYQNKICIENTTLAAYDAKEVKSFGGLCIDFSHLESIRIYKHHDYLQNLKIMSETKAGCAHISAVGKYLPYFPFWAYLFSEHYLRRLSEVDYLLKYKKFFPEIMALELENSIAEQLKIINYLSSKI